MDKRYVGELFELERYIKCAYPCAPEILDTYTIGSTTDLYGEDSIETIRTINAQFWASRYALSKCVEENNDPLDVLEYLIELFRSYADHQCTQIINKKFYTDAADAITDIYKKLSEKIRLGKEIVYGD